MGTQWTAGGDSHIMHTSHPWLNMALSKWRILTRVSLEEHHSASCDAANLPELCMWSAVCLWWLEGKEGLNFLGKMLCILMLCVLYVFLLEETHLRRLHCFSKEAPSTQYSVLDGGSVDCPDGFVRCHPLARPAATVCAVLAPAVSPGERTSMTLGAGDGAGWGRS